MSFNSERGITWPDFGFRLKKINTEFGMAYKRMIFFMGFRGEKHTLPALKVKWSLPLLKVKWSLP
jgi:hypothetical protein